MTDQISPQARKYLEDQIAEEEERKAFAARISQDLTKVVMDYSSLFDEFKSLQSSRDDLLVALEDLKEQVGKLPATQGEGWGRMVAALCGAEVAIAKARNTSDPEQEDTP